VFFDVSYQSYLPALIGTDDLVDGNGKLGASQSFAALAGPGLGGGLVGLVGAARAMSADAISYVVSVASLVAIRARERPPQPDQRQKLTTEIAEGLSFVLRHPILRKIVACTGTANLFGAMAMALEIIFLVRLLHVRPADTGLLIAVASLGGVAGGALGLFPIGELFPGAFTCTIFVFLDMLDGVLARMKGTTGTWGAFLDSTMDRIADAGIFSGLVIWFMLGGRNPLLAGVCLFCLVAGNLVSYVKARAEGLGLRCDVGLIERPERMVISLVAVGVSGLGVPYILNVGLWALAVIYFALAVMSAFLVKRRQAHG